MNVESLPEWLSAIGTIAATIAAVVIAAYTFRIGQRNKKYEGLRYVFELLDDNGHRNARRRIINLHGEKDEKRKIKILRLMGVKKEDIDRKEAILTESKEIVKADFEEVGSLLKNGEIPHDDFIKIYWRDIYKCWHVLEKEILRIQENIDKNYMQNFKYLKEKAIEYATNNLNIQDFSQFVNKDIIVYPKLERKDYDPNLGEISFQSDEYLDKKTLTDTNIYLMDKNKGKIMESQLDIDYNNDLKLIIIKIIEKTQNKNCYLCLSTNIKDIYGNPLEEDIQTEHTVL